MRVQGDAFAGEASSGLSFQKKNLKGNNFSGTEITFSGKVFLFFIFWGTGMIFSGMIFLSFVGSAPVFSEYKVRLFILSGI